MEKIKAVIFDIDGVLVDSRKAVVHNTLQLMREFGFDVPKEKVNTMSSAHSAETVLVTLVPSLRRKRSLLKKMLLRLSELTRENLHMIKPLFMIRRIQKLSEKYLLAIATNRKRSAKLILQKFKVEQYFSCVMTSADAAPKPSPQMLISALKALQVKPNEALFVGDNKEDALAAKRATVKFLLLDGKNRASCQKFVLSLMKGEPL
ncbi:MAG: HAD-IA family hydrolase [Candidatus Anstonellaceae archaeon]